MDLDTDASIGEQPSVFAGILTFLGLGKVPFAVWLIAFLTCFGIVGLVGQQFAMGLINIFIPWQFAVPIVVVAICPVLSRFCGFVARLVPSLETVAIDQQTLIAKTACIIQGTAKTDLSAQAKVIDQHGNPHYVRVVPMGDDEEFPTGTDVRLVSVERGVYRAIKL